MGYLSHWNAEGKCRYCPRDNPRPHVGMVGLLYHDHCDLHLAEWEADRKAMEEFGEQVRANLPAYKFPWGE